MYLVLNCCFKTVSQERERKERFEEAVRQKELKKAEMAQKLVSPNDSSHIVSIVNGLNSGVSESCELWVII